MIELYYWTTPNGNKPLIFLEEAGLDYHIKPVNIAKGEQFDPAFLKISPNNRVPAIVDGSLTLFESGAILQYLAEMTGKFLPFKGSARAEVLQWLNWQMGGLGPMFGQYLHFMDYAYEDIPYAKQRYTQEVKRLLGVLDKALDGNDYVAGEYSIADMAIYPWIRTRIDRFEGFANVRRWAESIASRPAVIRTYEIAAAINTAPTITEDSKALLFGIAKDKVA